MMVCKDCGCIFPEEDVGQEFISDDIGYVDICPYCASYDIYSASEDRF